MERFIFYALFPYDCFPFLRWVKFCSGHFRQVFFSFRRQKKWSLVALDKCSSYTVTIVWEFAWADSALVVLDLRLVVVLKRWSFEQVRL